jgi:hypothetical protein
MKGDTHMGYMHGPSTDPVHVDERREIAEWMRTRFYWCARHAEWAVRLYVAAGVIEKRIAQADWPEAEREGRARECRVAAEWLRRHGATYAPCAVEQSWIPCAAGVIERGETWLWGGDQTKVRFAPVASAV